MNKFIPRFPLVYCATCRTLVYVKHQGVGFITTGFRPVFLPTGFIALFCNRWKMDLGSKNFRSRVFGRFLVPGFSALFVYNLITQKEQENHGLKNWCDENVTGFWAVFGPRFFCPFVLNSTNQKRAIKLQSRKTSLKPVL